MSGAIVPHQALIDSLCGRYCTLDGRPAVVMGRHEPFATVATLDRSASAEWSWLAVERTLRENEGRFYTEGRP